MEARVEELFVSKPMCDTDTVTQCGLCPDLFVPSQFVQYQLYRFSPLITTLGRANLQHSYPPTRMEEPEQRLGFSHHSIPNTHLAQSLANGISECFWNKMYQLCQPLMLEEL